MESMINESEPVSFINAEQMNNKLFENVRYYLINSSSPEVETNLANYGAQKDKYLSSFITHVICDDIQDNSDYSEAKEVFELTIVKSEWINQCINSNTLLPVEPFNPDSSTLIFNSINIVNLNIDDMDSLKSIYAMLCYYGASIYDKSKSITHALSINYDENTKNADENEKTIKIVTPDWITDSIMQNQLVNEITYNPKYLIGYNDNSRFLFQYETQSTSSNVQEEAASAQPINILTETLSSPKTSHKITLNTKPTTPVVSSSQFDANRNSFDQNNSVFISERRSEEPDTLSKDDQQSNSFQNTTPPSTQQTTPIKRQNKKQSNFISTDSVNTNSSCNNNFTDDMNEIFQTVIGTVNSDDEKDKNNRKSQMASQNGDENLIELPESNAVVPICFELTESIKSLNSNINDSVTPSKNNINTEKYYVQENSHLIKFDCCLLGCVFYIVLNEHYYTNDCVSEWKNVMERFGGKVVDDYENNRQDITHVICPNRFGEIYKMAIEDKKRTVSAFWVEDVLQERKLQPPWRAYHFPSPYDPTNGPLTNHIISTHGFYGIEKLVIKATISLLSGKYSSSLSNINTYLISKNSDGLKIEKAKKWNVNIVNGLWLMELYLGNTFALNKQIDDRYTNLSLKNHFGYDQILVSDFMDQWKTLIKLPIERIKEANQSLSNLSPSSRQTGTPVKRQLRSRSPSPSSCKVPKPNTENFGISWLTPSSTIPIVMFTGLDPKQTASYQRDIISLGGIVSKHPSKTTHLVVDKIDRTAKLLKCISTCEYIVSLKWVIDSKNEGTFKDPNQYEVKDENFEKHYNCSLKESFERAKERRPLFEGLTFYLSPSVRPSYKDLEEMVRSAGGAVTSEIPNYQQFLEPFKDDKKTGLTCRFVVVGAQNDLNVLSPFLARKIPIYHEELILTGLLKQQIEAKIFKFH